MGGDPPAQGRSLIGGVPHERVPEAERPARYGDQPRTLGGLQVLDRGPQPARRAQHEGQFPGVVRGGDQQHHLRRFRQPVDLAGEGLLQPAGQRGGPFGQGQRAELSRPLGRRERAREIEEGERVAVRLLDDRLRDGRRQPGHQGCGRRPVEPSDGERGKPGCHAAASTVARSEQQGGGFGSDPAGREGERVHRRLVEPLHVVDQTEERSVGAEPREHRQHPEADDERVLHAVVAEAEDRPQRGGLGRRKPVDEVQYGQEQLVQPAEGEVHLRFDALDAQQAHSAGSRRGVVEQRGLAYARLAVQEEGGAPPPSAVGQDQVDPVLLRTAPQQHPVLAPASSMAPADQYDQVGTGGSRGRPPRDAMTPRARAEGTFRGCPFPARPNGPGGG